MQVATLENLADRIERATGGYIRQGTVTPRCVRFELSTRRAVTVEELAEALADLGLTAQVERRGRAATVIIERQDAEPVRLLPLLEGLRGVPEMTGALGVAEDGAPLLIRLPSPDVGHVLIIDDLALLRSLLLSLAMRHPNPDRLAVVLAGDGLGDLAELPHVVRVAARSEIMELLSSFLRLAARRELERVYDPPVVLAVNLCGAAWRFGDVTRMLVGKQVGVHILACASETFGLAWPVVIERGREWHAVRLRGGDVHRFAPAEIEPEETRQVVNALRGER